MSEELLKAMDKKGMRNKTRVMVGGAPVSRRASTTLRSAQRDGK